MVNTRITNFFTKGHERSVKSKLNILSMLFIKGGSILIGLLLLPMTLDYVDSETYGVWITISSMVAWISFFDVGIGNGLKNKLAEAIAHDDEYLGKKYVSTTYALMTLIFIPLMSVLLLFIVPNVNWSKLMNLSNSLSNELNKAIMICVTYFCTRFILSIFNTIMQSFQKPAIASLVGLLEQFSTLLMIIILTKLTEGSLINLSIALCIPPLVVLLISNIFLFSNKYRYIAPSFKFVDFSVAPDLLKLGAQFFIIQMAGIIQFQMVNFLILRNYGPSEVTAYNASYKYFSVLNMIWSILTAPLWVAFTDALTKNDFLWIINVLKKYSKLLCLFILGGILMLAISGIVYDIWLGDKVYIAYKISLCVMLYNVSTMISNLFVTFLNGAGRLKVQTIACCISPLVFLGMCFSMIHMGYGIESIIIASIVCNFNGLILAPIQTFSIVKTKRNDFFTNENFIR